MKNGKAELEKGKIMTPDEYYDLCVQYWNLLGHDWFKNMDMQHYLEGNSAFIASGLKFDRFNNKKKKNRLYITAAEKVLESNNRIEVWKIGVQNWTLKPGRGSQFAKIHPKPRRRKKR